VKFYKLHRTHEAGISAGLEYFTSRRAAESALSIWRRNSPGDVEDQTGEIEVIEVEPTRAGILSALNKYANHADNG
jgi:hypothetical protein